ncbi:MAG: EAL domain-containing protein [Planctomycetota bacterium]
MDIFVARQPILDRSQNTYGYELLFRSGTESIFTAKDPEQATGQVIVDSFFTSNLGVITGNHRAFINFTRETLLRGYATFLPKETVVVEILENVAPEKDILSACRNLKELGYTLALDDFEGSSKMAPLVKLADIIKIDFLQTSRAACRSLAHQFRRQRKTLLAEKVESQEDYAEAVKMGFELFQGYYFGKPARVHARAMPESRVAKLALVRAAQEKPLDMMRIEQIIKRDAALSYRLLKMINSAFFGMSKEIVSIRRAILLLGEKQIQKWASLLGLACMAEGKPPELLLTAIVRARFCELPSPLIGMGRRQDEAFLFGMFSLFDAILDMPMRDILNGILLAPDLTAALLGEESVLRHLFQAMTAFETGNWAALSELQSKGYLPEAEISKSYFEAVRWATPFLEETGAEQSSRA